MSKAHVEKFGNLLVSDPDMSEKLGLSRFLDALESNDSDAQVASKVTFVDNAVKEATSRGLIFSADEFNDFLYSELLLAMQSGELSDQQLEAVAGGFTGSARAHEHPWLGNVPSQWYIRAAHGHGYAARQTLGNIFRKPENYK